MRNESELSIKVKILMKKTLNKYRLREIKHILEYPENVGKVKLAPMMEMIINEDDQTQSITRNY